MAKFLHPMNNFATTGNRQVMDSVHDQYKNMSSQMLDLICELEVCSDPAEQKKLNRRFLKLKLKRKSEELKLNHYFRRFDKLGMVNEKMA